jgi:hypothetical protein
MSSSGTASKPQHALSALSSEPILVAVPARDDKRIEVYQFPHEKLAAVVPRVEPTETGKLTSGQGSAEGSTQRHSPPLTTWPTMSQNNLVQITNCNSGMVMAVKLAQHEPSRNTLVIAGYEGGFTAVHFLPRSSMAEPGAPRTSIPTIARTIYLSQPHTQPILSLDALPDGTTYFTSAADAVIAAHRVPDLPCQKDLDTPDITSPAASDVQEPSSEGKSALLKAQSPYKTIGTKHAGQQSLRVRSDGRLLATGGWDSRVRVYSTKTLKEMAVLKWHKEGVYAVDFGVVLEAEDIAGPEKASTADSAGDEQVVRRETGLSRLQRQREEQVQLKHWVVAGAKDGKVSLWEIF